MKNRHFLRLSVLLMASALALIASTVFSACTIPDPGAGFPVTITWNGGSKDGSRGLVGVNAVQIRIYRDDTGESIGIGNLAPIAGGRWSGRITIASYTGNAVFEANALDTAGQIVYVGKITQMLVGSGDFVTIPAGLATIIGGSIQKQPLSFTGMVNTFAGTKATQGTQTGVGILAGFNNPYGITTDGTNLYVTDFKTCKISKIVISTQVVTDFIGHAGSGGRTEGTGADAYFNTPRGITSDGTNLYVCDYGNNAIRRITVVGGTPSVTGGFVGTDGATGGAIEGLGVATGTFQGPSGITYFDGNLYVADTGNHKIRKIVIASLETTTIAGPSGIVGSAAFRDGTAVNAQFNWPQGITNDGTYLYVADTVNNRIRRIVMVSGIPNAEDVAGDTITLAGTGVAGSSDGTNGSNATFNGPIGITTDGTYLYVADSTSDKIRMISNAKTALTAAGTTVVTLSGGVIAGTLDARGVAAGFYGPYGITTDGTNLFVTEYSNYDIRKIQ